MDPDEALRVAVEDARSIVATSEDEVALRMADHVLSLHDWLMKGGALPAAWSTCANGRVRG